MCCHVFILKSFLKMDAKCASITQVNGNGTQWNAFNSIKQNLHWYLSQSPLSQLHIGVSCRFISLFLTV